MSINLAAAFHAIDPAVLGTRIRNARTVAGRTQADVAADEVTAAYVSRIEAGQRKPDFHLLGRLAERAGTTLAALLAPDDSSDRDAELQVRIDHAELTLASGQAVKALTQIDQLLPSLDADGATAAQVRAAHRVRARALEATGRLEEAITAFEDLTSTSAGDLAWLQDLIALSRCFRESGDLDSAINTGEQAEASIQEHELAGLTEAIQLTVTVSSAYVARGDLEHAMRLCLRAADAADKHDSPIGRASAHWEASIIETNRGHHHDALELARRAMAFFEVADDARNLGRLRSQIAIIQLRLSPPDAQGALATLGRAKQELDWSPASTVDQARVELSRAKAHYLLGQHEQAAEALTACQRLLPESAVFLHASARALAGQIALATGSRQQAHREMTSAIQTLSGVGADREAAQLWYELGSMLEELGDTAGALDAFRRAGASTGLHPRSAPNLARVSESHTGAR